jgi:hypothetical protein
MVRLRGRCYLGGKYEQGKEKKVKMLKKKEKSGKIK